MTIKVYTDNGDMTAKLYGETAKTFFDQMVGQATPKEFVNQDKIKKVKYIVNGNIKKIYDLYQNTFCGQVEIIKLELMLFENYFFIVEPN